MVDNVVIMAGGAGKRLWPASMGKRPKQFMTVDGGVSLFRGTLDRAFALGIEGKIYVVTHQDHVESAASECDGLPADQRNRVVMLAEPAARNTAPALALAAARMELDGLAEQTVLVMAADHLISPPEAFTSSVNSASRDAESDFIVPYGIVPTFPSTGYGYIEAGEAAGEGFEVISFREKPDSDTAAGYVDSGRYYWNAGLFTYRSRTFAAELALHAPDVASVFENPAESWFRTDEDDGVMIHMPSDELAGLYGNCPSISVDYAVMERSSRIRMVRAAFDWNDVGSWDVIAELGARPAAPVYSLDSSDNFVYSNVPVALCGVENLIVVVSNGRVMVCRKGMSQLVKEAAEEDLKDS